MDRLEHLARRRPAAFLDAVARGGVHDQRIDIEGKHGLVARMAAQQVPVAGVEQREVAAGVGVQLAQTPMDRLLDPFLRRRRQRRDLGEQSIVVEIPDRWVVDAEVVAIDTVHRIRVEAALGQPGDDVGGEERVAGFGGDEAAARPANADIGRLADVDAALLRADMMDVVLRPGDEAANRHVPERMGQGEGLQQEWTVRHGIPFDDDDLGVDPGMVELGGKAIGRAIDTTEVVRRVTVVAAPGHEADVGDSCS